MTEEISSATHRRLAVDANNSTWEHLSKPWHTITPDEAEEMTRRAYAAAYHWNFAEGATPANAARAHWLLSRVWSVRSHGDLALDHARRCLALCESHSLIDFDLAYAHEAMARAHACMGHVEEAKLHLAKARAVDISDPEDRAVVDGDLAAEPWFGVA